MTKPTKLNSVFIEAIELFGMVCFFIGLVLFATVVAVSAFGGIALSAGGLSLLCMFVCCLGLAWLFKRWGLV